jgi:hypothetical protein
MDSSIDPPALQPASSSQLLPPTRQRRLAHDLAKIVAFVATPPPGGPEAELVEHVDIPKFVAALIEGLLKAMVHGEDASDHQMRAYAQLVEAVRRSVDEFQYNQQEQHAQHAQHEQTDVLPDRPHHDYLTSKYPELVGSKPITPATKRALVADILLMGIERVVAQPPAAARGAVKAKAKVKAKPTAKATSRKPAAKVKRTAKPAGKGKAKTVTKPRAKAKAASAKKRTSRRA